MHIFIDFAKALFINKNSNYWVAMIRNTRVSLHKLVKKFQMFYSIRNCGWGTGQGAKGRLEEEHRAGHQHCLHLLLLLQLHSIPWCYCSFQNWGIVHEHCRTRAKEIWHVEWRATEKEKSWYPFKLLAQDDYLIWYPGKFL